MTGHASTSRVRRWDRGVCALCGREVAIRYDGTVWSHRGGKPDPQFNCHGSYRAPAKVARDA